MGSDTKTRPRVTNQNMNSVICRQLPLCWRNASGRTLYYRPLSKMSTSTTKFWLLKAEPDARIVKGKNVQVGFRSTYHSDYCHGISQRTSIVMIKTLNTRRKNALNCFTLSMLTSLGTFSSVSMILNASEHHLGRVYGIMRLEI